MDEFGPASYGDAFADVYDRWYPDVTDVDACVARLAELAASGRVRRHPDGSPERAAVLELGVGTGRLALPLAARGLAVTGVDASAAMLERLAAKPGAGQLRLVAGDMADLDATDLDRPSPSGSAYGPPFDGSGPPFDGYGPPFDLAFVAYNTLFNLVDDDAQARCLAGVAARLAPGASLVFETFVPVDPGGPDGGAGGSERADALAVNRIGPGEVVLTASRHDEQGRTIVGQHIQITEAGTRLRPWRVHYLRPDQLDHLAVGAGLVPHERWRDWHGHPFDDDSPTLISVYGS